MTVFTHKDREGNSITTANINCDHCYSAAFYSVITTMAVGDWLQRTYKWPAWYLSASSFSWVDNPCSRGVERGIAIVIQRCHYACVLDWAG